MSTWSEILPRVLAQASFPELAVVVLAFGVEDPSVKPPKFPAAIDFVAKAIGAEPVAFRREVVNKIIARTDSVIRDARRLGEEVGALKTNIPDATSVHGMVRAFAARFAIALSDEAEKASVAESRSGDPVEPPWKVFSEHPESLRWRMGRGQDHMSTWWTYWLALSPEERRKYLQDEPPPAAWREWAERALGK